MPNIYNLGGPLKDTTKSSMQHQMAPPNYNHENSNSNWPGLDNSDRLSLPQRSVADKDSTVENMNNVSRMFHRNNLRSLSLASASDLNKTHIANYLSQFIDNQKNGQNSDNPTPKEYRQIHAYESV